MTKLGAYLGASSKSVLQFEDWLGRDVDYVQVHTGRASWWDYENSVAWAGAQVVQLNKAIYWTIPMFANGGTLAEAAAGAYTDHWVKAAQNMLATRSSDNQIIVRFGEEFNGNWMPWAAKGNEQAYIQAYRGMVDAFRSVSDKFVFDWNVNVGNQGMDPAKAYPGDDYVDYITMDVYYNTAWDPKDPSAAFDYMLKRSYGLNWLDAFAKAHDKPIAFPEWGVMSDNAGPYIAKFAAWMETHNVAYQSYWNSDADFAGALSTGTKPNAGAAYIDAFGDATHTGNVAPVGLGDAYVVQENVSLTVAKVAGVLANDKDADGDALTAMLVDGPQHGTLSLRVDGSLIYTPDTNYSGADSFTYTPRDAKGAGNVTTVKLTVVDSRDAPASGKAVSWTSGTSGNDTLVGDARNNSLNGGTGQDTMKGGLGDDTYTVDHVNDVVVENPGEGIDTVESWSPSYTLAANVENLILKGTGGQVGIGNNLANGITGGAGADTLNGKGGNDWLTGGTGSDIFVFEPGAGHDIVRDFVTSGTGQDVVKLSGYGYASFAEIKAAMSQVGTDTLLKLSDGSSVTFLNHKVADFTASHFKLPNPTYTVSGQQRVTEGSDIVFTVSRTEDNGEQTLSYKTSGSATSGLDYVAPSGKVTFDAGELTKQIVIATKTDGLVEGNESLVVTLSGVTGAGTIGSAKATTGAIIDSLAAATQPVSVQVPVAIPKPPSVYTVQNSATVVEGGNLVFTVTRTSDDGAQTVKYGLDGTATAGLDYVAPSGTVTFAAGELTKQIILSTKADALVEGSESVSLSLSSVTGTGLFGAEKSASGSIIDPRPTAPPESGKSASWIYGTSGNDTLTGDKFNNYLHGGAGQDTAKGGAGDDTYNVESMNDKVIELDGQGIDTVESWGHYTLSANVENLKLLGLNSTGTGNELANLIVGGKGADTLNGKGGNDWLTGGLGSDTFVFEKGAGHDVITDFATTGAGQDLVKLMGVDFATFADVKAAMIQVGSDTLLKISDDTSVTFLNHKISDFLESDFVL